MRSAQHSPQAINSIDWIALQHSQSSLSHGEGQQQLHLFPILGLSQTPSNLRSAEFAIGVPTSRSCAIISPLLNLKKKKLTLY